MKELIGLKVLLAEDSLVTQMLITNILEEVGVEVLMAKSGVEAVQIAQNNSIDLVLMDINMPEMNGIEAAIEIKKINNCIDVPIIGLSGETNERRLMEFKEAGIGKNINKPVSPNDLLDVIVETINSKSTNKAFFNKVEKMSETELYSLETISEISRGDEEFIQRMVKIFISETPKAIEEIEAALVSLDYARIKAVIHKIKPSLKMMRINSITEEAQALEDYTDSLTNLNEVPGLVSRIKEVCVQVVNDLE